MKLVDLPGIGSRTRERLIEYYGDEERALQAITIGDIAGLSKSMSERQALTLVQYSKGLKYAVKPNDFLATDEAIKCYEMIVTRLASFAHTEYARLKICTLFPASSSDLLLENQNLTKAAMDTAKLAYGRGLDDLLRSIRPLREKTATRVRERAVAATSAEAFQMLKARGFDKLIDLHLAESPQELTDLAKSYNHTSLIGEDVGGSAGLELAESMEDWYLVPEMVLGFYKENMESLRSALEAARRLKEIGIDNFSGWEELRKLVQRLDESDDSEAARLTRLASGLNSALGETISWANEELKKRIEKSSLTLEGTDLLNAMNRGESVREIFEMKMRGDFQEAIKEAKARASNRLELAGSESVWLDEIFPIDVCYPLEIDRKALHSFEQDLRSRMEERSLKRRRELAHLLADRKEEALALIRALMDFDFVYSIGSFAIANELTMPEITQEPCLSLEGGHHLFMEKPEPVSYSLGSKDHPEKVALLSGVNSGGKTSLLDLIAQTVILAHMGLPVPAKSCKLCIFQEMYYFGKSRGTLSAGAFETAMKKFAVVENQKRKLVLADELESITEPGASARIIATILDELNRRDCVAIFVSHLAEDVRRFAETKVRVDGIEADGLDENDNLKVNRSPRYNCLARSTPELILDRLVRTTRGREKEFYMRLLEKFK